MGFDIAIEAIRFILVGGTYAPTDYLLTTNPLDLATPTSLSATSILTARELSVVAGIKQGKPNKTIAYELNMCESTVKVHMRNIMKKLHAKNRTEVAMRA
jgi:DNA-binding NarL/FixJ family response regulator